MREFKTYHPLVNFTYFVFVIGFSCFFMHPVCLAISLFCGFTCSAMLKGWRSARKSLRYILPMMLMTAVLNPLFNHAGVRVIAYLPGGNPLTAESILYGLCAACMIACVICHFSCLNQVMTSDKIIYLFGGIIPAASLILSMTLRFVPAFSAQLKRMSDARRALRGEPSGGAVKRAKSGLKILSAMLTWSLENAADTADSMRARGYGIPGRSTFSVFRFGRRDKIALASVLIPGVYILVGGLTGCMDFGCFPSVHAAGMSAYSLSVFFAYGLLCAYPIIIEIREVRRWRSFR